MAGDEWPHELARSRQHGVLMRTPTDHWAVIFGAVANRVFEELPADAVRLVPADELEKLREQLRKANDLLAAELRSGNDRVEAVAAEARAELARVRHLNGIYEDQIRKDTERQLADARRGCVQLPDDWRDQIFDAVRGYHRNAPSAVEELVESWSRSAGEAQRHVSERALHEHGGEAQQRQPVRDLAEFRTGEPMPEEEWRSFHDAVTSCRGDDQQPPERRCGPDDGLCDVCQLRGRQTCEEKR